MEFLLVLFICPIIVIVASINLETTFHRPVFSGKVENEAKVEKFGKKVSYITATFTQNRKHVASATSSVIVMTKNKV